MKERSFERLGNLYYVGWWAATGSNYVQPFSVVLRPWIRSNWEPDADLIEIKDAEGTVMADALVRSRNKYKHRDAQMLLDLCVLWNERIE